MPYSSSRRLPRWLLSIPTGWLVVTCAAPHPKAQWDPPRANAETPPDPALAASVNPAPSTRAPARGAMLPVTRGPLPSASTHSAREASVSLELERPLWPYYRPRPDGPIVASLHDEKIACWNVGGTSDPKHPSSKSRYHPAVRVVVDTAVVGAWHRTTSLKKLSRLILARVRKHGYWPIRTCYESALRNDQDLSGKAVIRIRVGRNGKVVAASRRRGNLNPTLEQCLTEAIRKVELRNVPARRTDVDVTVKLWPGDAPVPRWTSLSPGESQPAGLSEQLDRAAAAWEATRPELADCAAKGLANDGGLWGRVALLATLSSAGEVTRAREDESRFPDPEVTRCLSRHLRQLRITPPIVVPQLVFALRVGQQAGKDDG
ncbi:hypothetical protein ACFL5O_05965 [Myxococcota bacterium]